MAEIDAALGRYGGRTRGGIAAVLVDQSVGLKLFKVLEKHLQFAAGRLLDLGA